MQRHGDAPVYSQSVLGRGRGRGMKGKLLTMAALELRGGLELGPGEDAVRKKVRPERSPDGRRNEQPTGGGRAVLAEKCLRLRRCSLSHRLPGARDYPTRAGFMRGFRLPQLAA
jgi:hypothetical protein